MYKDTIKESEALILQITGISVSSRIIVWWMIIELFKLLKIRLIEIL